MVYSGVYGWPSDESGVVIPGIRAGMIQFPDFFTQVVAPSAEKSGVSPN